MENNKHSSEIWDLKEKNYPKFDDKDSEFEKKIINFTQDWGIRYDNKKVFEVGCGTGAYTILLAPIAKHIYALDFSQQMLKSLKESAIKFGVIDKITCIISDFLEYKDDRAYDITFAAMTPALDSEYAFIKFNKLGKIHIWLGWAGKRESKVMNEVFKSHDQELRVPNTSKHLKEWLEKQNISYKNKVLEHKWKSELSLEDMVDDQAIHLKMQGIEPNLEIIKKVLTNFIDKNSKIVNETDVRLELIYW